MLSPLPEIKPVPPVVEAWSLNHWTTMEVPSYLHFKNYYYFIFLLFWLGNIHYPVSDCWSILLHLLVCCWFPLVYFSFLLICFPVLIGSFLYLPSHCCSSHQVHPFSRVQWTTLRLLIWTFHLVNCLFAFCLLFPLVLSCFLICRLFLCFLILPLCICLYMSQLHLPFLKAWPYVGICGPEALSPQAPEWDPPVTPCVLCVHW